MSRYATYLPAGIYQLDNGTYRKVEPCYMSPNHRWLAFETPGGFIIDYNATGRRFHATTFAGEVAYDQPYAIPVYVRRAVRAYAKRSHVA